MTEFSKHLSQRLRAAGEELSSAHAAGDDFRVAVLADDIAELHRIARLHGVTVAL